MAPPIFPPCAGSPRSGLPPLPDEGRVALRGDRLDRHLFATAEQDETIRHLTLAGDRGRAEQRVVTKRLG
jgi:hypothetical protein